MRGDLGEQLAVGDAGAGLAVGRVDPGHDHPDADFAGSRRGLVALDELENVGAAVGAIDDCLHDGPLFDLHRTVRAASNSTTVVELSARSG
jgi:hypothetical protein